MQVLFKLLLTSRLPLSHWQEQVALPSPRSEEKNIAEDIANGADAGERFGTTFAMYQLALGKAWPPLRASVPAFF